MRVSVCVYVCVCACVCVFVCVFVCVYPFACVYESTCEAVRLLALPEIHGSRSIILSLYSQSLNFFLYSSDYNQFDLTCNDTFYINKGYFKLNRIWHFLTLYLTLCLYNCSLLPYSFIEILNFCYPQFPHRKMSRLRNHVEILCKPCIVSKNLKKKSNQEKVTLKISNCF